MKYFLSYNETKIITTENINDTSKTRDNPICSSTKEDKPESVQEDCK